MKEIIHNPTDGIYPAPADYVHGLEVVNPSRTLYLAGTMGLAPDGSAPETLETQLEFIWRNIRRILASAGMTTDNIVRVTSYLRDASFASANGAARERALGNRRVPTTAVVVQTLAPEWMVEIEVIAVA